MKNRILWTSALLVSGLGTLLTGCKNAQQGQMAPIVDGSAAGTDPAAVNLAPGTQVAANSYAFAPQANGQSYPAQAPQTAPVTRNEAYNYNTQPPQSAPVAQDGSQYPDQQAAAAAEYDEYSDLLDPNTPYADQAPPPLPSDYEQPEAPGPDYLWTPGYWDYASSGYYYVPGVWVAAPYEGALWTPGWWGFVGGHYRWHHGYWGRHVGFYGGINYGFGYIGFGYQGGYWNNNHFYYNTAVNRVRPEVVNHFVYDRRVAVNNNAFVNNSRVSYFGGNGGLRRGPAPQELAAVHEQRTPPMQAQIQHRQQAEANRQQFFNANHGRPQMVAVARPLAADRNISPPSRVAPNMPQQFNNGRTMPRQQMVNGRPQQMPANATPQQREQFSNQQRQMQETQQRQQMEQQRNQQQTNVQRQQMDTQRQQQMQQQQRQQMDAQHNQQLQMQQRQQEQQRQQQANVQRQQQMQVQQRQQEQQRQQQMESQQRAQQQVQQRQQQENQQRAQQAQAQAQQRQVEQRQMMQQQHAAPAPRPTPPPAARPMPVPQAHPTPSPQGEHRR